MNSTNQQIMESFLNECAYINKINTVLMQLCHTNMI